MQRNALRAELFTTRAPQFSHTPEPGFGMLFLDSDGRLSTAETPGDLGVDQDGKHARGDKRYQIVRV